MQGALRKGLMFEFSYQVSENKTVPNLYPESEEFQSMPDVFATGFMVDLLEWACISAIKPYLCILQGKTYLLSTRAVVH